MKELFAFIVTALIGTFLAVKAVELIPTGYDRPANGFRNGQIVYVKSSCHKRVIVDWDSYWNGYDTAAQEDDDRHFDKPDDIVADPKDCVKW